MPGAERALVARLYAPPDLDGPRPLCSISTRAATWSAISTGARRSAACSQRRALPRAVDRLSQGTRAPLPRGAGRRVGGVSPRARARGSLRRGSRAVAVGGDSAGGGLAAMIAQRARAERVRPPRFQLLIYPWLFAAPTTPPIATSARARRSCARTSPGSLTHYLSADRRARRRPFSRPASRASSPGSPRRWSTPRASTSCATRASSTRSGSRRPACRWCTAATSRFRTASALLAGTAPAASRALERSRTTSTSSSPGSAMSRTSTVSLCVMAAVLRVRGVQPLPRAGALLADHAALAAMARRAGVPVGVVEVRSA